MTPLDRLESAGRSAWLPLTLLLLALSTVFAFGGERGSFYRPSHHNTLSLLHFKIALNLSVEHRFVMFSDWKLDADDAPVYALYNRFPIGGYASMKLAALPFGGSPSAQLTAARILMLSFFVAAALLAYLSLCRLVSNRWIALTATLLAFSSYYLLYYNDMVSIEVAVDFFGVMLTFHGMVVFVQERRFRQLLVKTCIALLLGWHVYALLLTFIILGLGGELLRARSGGSAFPLRLQLMQMAGSLIRSRYLLLGIIALLFGLAILAFNFTNEYFALDGERPLTELPSFQSMLNRTSVAQGAGRASWPWAPFLEVQFLRIVLMFIPYSLVGSGGGIENLPWQTEFQNTIVRTPNTYPPLVTAWLSEVQGVVLAVILSGACLVGLMFVRQRMLFATLASFGFFWALPMRMFTLYHDFESVYYIGIPLVASSLILLYVHRMSRSNRLVAAVSVVALLLFAASSLQMSRVGYSAESIQFTRAMEQDLIAIRDVTAGRFVAVLNAGSSPAPQFEFSGTVSYYLRENVIQTGRRADIERGFIVLRERIDTDALLTPENQYFFLYESAGLIEAYQSMYRSIASGKPLERSNFDVYLKENRLHYLKEPCVLADTQTPFFLHVVPIDLYDLPDDRRGHGFDNLDFGFGHRGVMFDGKCLAIVRLPHYDAASVRTGQFDGDGEVWSVEYVDEDPSLMAEYQSIVSGELAASAEFDLYIDGRALYYVKEPCGAEDTQPPFFLHVVPADLDDLPDDRRGHGFDNLDFGFDVRGVMFDDRCVARVFLPKHDVARITTGQYDGANRIWEVELDLEADE